MDLLQCIIAFPICNFANEFSVLLRNQADAGFGIIGDMDRQPEKPIAKKVIMSITLRFASSRDVLLGVFRHIETLSGWSISLMQEEVNPLTVENVRSAENDHILGIFVTEPGSEELMMALHEMKLPVVSIGVRNAHLESRRYPTVFVHNDNAAIGDMGARHFFRLRRFNSYGFVMAGIGDDWAKARCDAFCSRIAASAPGSMVAVFPPTATPGSQDDTEALADWIAALPKSTAIMAACDWRAVQVLSACERAHVRVPDAAAVLGVDNDEFLCEHASPPLSSILPGHVEMGRLAAQALEGMVGHGGGKRHAAITVPPSRIVERESTRMRTPSAALVDKARRFIHENATKGIGVKDVVAHLRVSRRLAEIRWRAATGETIRTSIEAVRMAKLKRLLVSTRRPLSTIAAECGYKDPDALAHIFRKRFGTTMSGWRRSNGKTTPGIH